MSSQQRIGEPLSNGCAKFTPPPDTLRPLMTTAVNLEMDVADHPYLSASSANLGECESIDIETIPVPQCSPYLLEDDVEKKPGISHKLIFPKYSSIKDINELRFMHWDWPLIRTVLHCIFWLVFVTIAGVVVTLIITAPKKCDPARRWWHGGVFVSVPWESLQSFPEGALVTELQDLDVVGAKIIEIPQLDVSDVHFLDKFVTNMISGSLKVVLELPAAMFRDIEITSTVASPDDFLLNLGIDGLILSNLEKFSLDEQKYIIQSARTVLAKNPSKNADKLVGASSGNYSNSESLDALDVTLNTSVSSSQASEHIQQQIMGAKATESPWLNWLLESDLSSAELQLTTRLGLLMFLPGGFTVSHDVLQFLKKDNGTHSAPYVFMKHMVELKNRTYPLWTRGVSAPFAKDPKVVAPNLKFIAAFEEALLLERFYPRRDPYIMCINLGDKKLVADFSAFYYGAYVVISSNSDKMDFEFVKFTEVTLNPGEIFIAVTST